MKTDKELLNQLNDLFDRFKKQASHKTKITCSKEIGRLQAAFNQISSQLAANRHKRNYSKANETILNETVHLIQKHIKKIDDECLSIETEMHGVQNYSDYEYNHVIHFAHKKELKETLIKLLNFLYTERPELKEKEPVI